MMENAYKNIKRINGHIQKGISIWGQTCKNAETFGWTKYMSFNDEDIENAKMILSSICLSIGGKAGVVGDKAADAFRERLDELVKDMTGRKEVRG